MIFIFINSSKKDNNNKKENIKEDNIITKNEAYSYIKDSSMIAEKDLLIFIEENDEEYKFEYKGSCEFSKCYITINKKDKKMASSVIE